MIWENPNGEIESLKVDNKTGVTTLVENEITTTYKTFVTPGVLFGKLRNVSKTNNGHFEADASVSYDELGRVVRRRGLDGFTTTFSYENGKSLRTIADTRDPVVLAKLHKKELELLKKVETSAIPEAKANTVKLLADFLIFEKKDSASALKWIQFMSPHDAWTVQLQSLNTDLNMNAIQKIEGYKALLTKYPERKDILEFLIKNTEQ